MSLLALLVLAGTLDAEIHQYDASCTGGDPFACAEAARQHISEVWRPATGESHGRDEKLAAWFGKLALTGLEPRCNGGNAKACVAVADLYDGGGLPQDDAKHVEWLEKGCLVGTDAWPCHDLGQIFSHGRGSTYPDLPRSIRALALACGLKGARACWALCGQLDVWMVSGPATLEGLPYGDLLEKLKLEPRCAAAATLWRGHAKQAAALFAAAWSSQEDDNDRAMTAAGGMLANRALGRTSEARAWAKKLAAALHGKDHVIAGGNLTSSYGAATIAAALVR